MIQENCTSTCFLFHIMYATRLEAIAIRLEAIAVKLESIAIRLEAKAIRLEPIASRITFALLHRCSLAGRQFSLLPIPLQT